ncbi:7815_t:CDS:2, partial [Racocetra persica]
NKISPAQFQQEVNKLFRINKNEYNARFVKLATDISTIGRTSIRAMNNEIVALSFTQNHPIDMSRFFGYDIMADESTRGEMKVLIICLLYWNHIKEKPIITVLKVKDLIHYNAETISTEVFEACQQKEIDPQKYHFWLTDNTAYMSSKANGAIAKFNSLAASKSFRIPCGLHATHIALTNFKNKAFGKLDTVKGLSLKEHPYNLFNLAFYLHDGYNLSDKD